MELFSDPNEALNKFYSLFNAVLDKHAKVKTKRLLHDTRPKWLTQEILQAQHMRDTLHKNKDFENFKIWRNKVTSLIENAKISYYKTAIEQNKNPKQMWDVLNNLASKSTNYIPAALAKNSYITEDTQEIVEMFKILIFQIFLQNFFQA